MTDSYSDNYLDDDELDADMDIGSFRKRSVFSQTTLSSSSRGPGSPLEQVLETKTAPRSNTSYADTRVSEEDNIEMKEGKRKEGFRQRGRVGESENYWWQRTRTRMSTRSSTLSAITPSH